MFSPCYVCILCHNSHQTPEIIAPFNPNTVITASPALLHTEMTVTRSLAPAPPVKESHFVTFRAIFRVQ